MHDRDLAGSLARSSCHTVPAGGGPRIRADHQHARHASILHWLCLQGGRPFSRVYLAKNKSTGELVALKKRTVRDYDEGWSESTLREISILRSLSHPNVVELRNVYVTNQRLIHLEMTRAKMTLLTLLQKLRHKARERLPRATVKVCCVGMQSASATRFAHATTSMAYLAELHVATPQCCRASPLSEHHAPRPQAFEHLFVQGRQLESGPLRIRIERRPPDLSPLGNSSCYAVKSGVQAASWRRKVHLCH